MQGMLGRGGLILWSIGVLGLWRREKGDGKAVMER
tara:strand:+ start:208 stop:312 length:105 start_codon:yes stop_codon:yes gene_type:complete